MKKRNPPGFTLLFLLFFSMSLNAQESITSVTAKLVGKTWVFYKAEGKMDGGSTVKYVFRNDHKVVITEKDVKKTQSWKLEQDSNGIDIYIFIAAKKYTLTFPKNSMKLRDKASNKSTITNDMYFKQQVK